MVKKTFMVLACITGLTIFIFTLHDQGSKKTLILPSGGVVYDLNGEWEVVVENYGPWLSFGSYPQIWKLTQTGNSFVAVRMIDDPYHQKGTEVILAELDESGFKKVQIIPGHYPPFYAKGQISEDGDKMIIDDGEKTRATATRK